MSIAFAVIVEENIWQDNRQKSDDVDNFDAQYSARCLPVFFILLLSLNVIGVALDVGCLRFSVQLFACGGNGVEQIGTQWNRHDKGKTPDDQHVDECFQVD